MCVLQEFLLSNDMYAFDPFNMSLTLSSLDTVSFIFVDAAAVSSVDRLPNLLRLKRDVRIMFRQFGSRDDVVQRSVTCVFPRAGVVVMHDDALLRCGAGMWPGLADFNHSDLLDLNYGDLLCTMLLSLHLNFLILYVDISLHFNFIFSSVLMIFTGFCWAN